VIICHWTDPETADFGGRETPIVSKTTLLRTADNPRQVQDDVTVVKGNRNCCLLKKLVTNYLTFTAMTKQ
jgi:hypothetical protein